jgi:hypothetical protein
MAPRKEHTTYLYAEGLNADYTNGSLLLLPSRTDIRPPRINSFYYNVTVIQVPSNRQFFWWVWDWYDVRRGYADEFRVGIILRIQPWWSAPPYD